MLIFVLFENLIQKPIGDVWAEIGARIQNFIFGKILVPDPFITIKGIEWDKIDFVGSLGRPADT